MVYNRFLGLLVIFVLSIELSIVSCEPLSHDAEAIESADTSEIKSRLGEPLEIQIFKGMNKNLHLFLLFFHSCFVRDRAGKRVQQSARRRQVH